MYPPPKQRQQKSNQKDVNNLVPSISMPSLASKPQLSVAIKSPFDMQRNSWQMKHKTAAETISETRRMLSNGVRLVSTRRPITPREPTRRQLYGKVSLSDRPPSAFSLSYLQLENFVLPPIGTTAAVPRPTKLSSLNSIPQQQQQEQEQEQPQQSVSSIKALNDEKTTSKTAKTAAAITTTTTTATTAAPSAASQRHAEPNTMVNNTTDLRLQTDTKNKHILPNGHPKLPTLSTESKAMVAAANFDALFGVETSTLLDVQHSKNGNNNNNNDINNVGNNIRRKFVAETTTSPISDILQDDGQIGTTLTTESNQSSRKKPIGEQQHRRLLPLRRNDLLAQSSTETLLEMLKSHAGIKDCSEETVLHINGILTELYTRIGIEHNDWRSSILSSLYGLVECTSAKILLSVARVVLVLDVTGSNLTGACKLVFKVARNERNDNLFANIDVPELLIDGLGRASPIDDAEACIYGYGAVRFLANAVVSADSNGRRSSMPTNASMKRHKTLSCRLIQHGAIPLLCLHLQMINEAGAAAKLPSQTLHALYQLSNAFRVLSKIIMLDHEQQLSIHSINNNKRSAPVESKSHANKHRDPYNGMVEASLKDFNGQITLAGPHLIRAAEICIHQAEVQSSIIRTLSILSEHEKCCDGIANMAPRLGILLGSLLVALPQTAQPRTQQRQKQKQPKNSSPENVNLVISNKSLSVLNRIAYIIGNVMAQSDSARLQFYNNDVAMEYLLQGLQYYANESVMLSQRQTRDQISNQMSSGGDGDASGSQDEKVRSKDEGGDGGNDNGTTAAGVNGSDESNNSTATATSATATGVDAKNEFDTVTDVPIDVEIKLIRVIANLSVNAEVGYKLANHHQLGAILLTLLNTINKQRENFKTEYDELLLATLGAIHNLSFYQLAIDDDTQTKDIKHPDSMIEQMATISAALCAIYQWVPESAAQSEIARVLGNLTRSVDARVAVYTAGGFQFLLKNLASNDWDIVETSCGVLVNMLSDWERRSVFRELRGPLLLREVLQRSAMKHDWLLALICCQAIWNYIIDSGNVVGALGEDEADYISADILEYLDEEKLFAGNTPDPQWEEFARVAADLLERIQSSLSHNNTPYASSASDDDDGGVGDGEEGDEYAKSDVLKMSKMGFKMWLANS